MAKSIELRMVLQGIMELRDKTVDAGEIGCYLLGTMLSI